MVASLLPLPLPSGLVSPLVVFEHLVGHGTMTSPKMQNFLMPDARGYDRISGAKAPGHEQGIFRFGESPPFLMKIWTYSGSRTSIKTRQPSILMKQPKGSMSDDGRSIYGVA